MHKNLSALFPVSIFLFLVFFIFFIYSFGTSGNFILDDQVNLERVNNYGGATKSLSSLKEYLFVNGQLTSRPVSFLSFLINDNAWPGDPASYKLTNILIHVLNTILLFIFARQIFRQVQFTTQQRNFAALIVMILWGLHPLNVSTVLYVVQRMAELSALFSLSALIIYLKGRKLIQLDQLKDGLIILTLVVMPLMALSFLSKQNGVVTLLFILLIEFTLFQKTLRPKLFKYWLSLFIIIPIMIIAGYFIFYWSGDTTFTYRGHNLAQHLLTQARVLTDYLGQFFIPSINRMGIFHDDYLISSDLFSPLSTLFSVILILTLITIGFFYHKQLPLVSFGILWFFSGHILESTFIPLETYFEHRNYLPLIGPVIACSYYIIIAANSQNINIRKTTYIFIPIIFLILTMQTLSLSKIWSNTPMQLALSTQSHPNSVRAALYFNTYLRATGQYEESYNLIKKAYKNTQNLNVLITHIDNSCLYLSKLPFPYKQVLTVLNNNRHHASVSSESISLANTIISSQCIDNPLIFLDQFFHSLEENVYVKINNKDLVQLYFKHADIAELSGDTDKAITLLDKAFKKQATPDIAFRQISIMIKQKKYQQAMKYLDKAKQANNKKPSLKLDRMDEINKIEYFLKEKNRSLLH